MKSSLKSWFLTIAVALGVVGFFVATFSALSGSPQQKIGVVRTADLLSEYQGVKDMQDAFAKQQEQWQRDFDTLQGDYKKSAEGLKSGWNNLNKSERDKKKTTVQLKEQQLVKFARNIEQQASISEDQQMQEIIHHLNAMVQKYAEENGYDVIYGATDDGSVLYSNTTLDITGDLITYLNSFYVKNKANSATTQ